MNMDHHYTPDYKSHNVIVPQTTTPPTYATSGWDNNELLLGLLLGRGILDRNTGVMDYNALNTQLTSIAQSLGTTNDAILAAINANAMQTCEQTQAITGAVHASSTANLVGQNVIGEKVSDVKYSGAINAKDAEKTTLIDGAVTRKNDDDNTNQIKNNQILGFASLEKGICETNHNLDTKIALLSSQYAEGTCKLSGEIKDLKYENLLVAERNQNATMASLKDLGFQNANIAKDTIIREKDDQLRMSEQTINTMQHNEIKEEIEELKRSRAKEAENNFMSHNIVANVGNSINVSLDKRLEALARTVDLLSHNVGIIIANNNIGRNNS